MASFIPPVADYTPPQSGYVNIIFISTAEAQKPALPVGISVSSEDQTKFLMGTDDYPLTEKGETQAQNLADSINRCGIAFERIYSGTLQKAQQTALPLAKSSGLEILPDARLNEISKGDIQSSFKGEYSQNETYKAYKKMTLAEQYFSPMGEGGETKALSTQRIISFLNDLRSDKSLDGKTIVVFTHGTPLKTLYTLNINPEAIKHPEELKETIETFLPLDDPQKCEAVQYQLKMDEAELKFNSKLIFSEDGTIQSAAYPRLKG